MKKITFMFLSTALILFVFSFSANATVLVQVHGGPAYTNLPDLYELNTSSAAGLHLGGRVRISKYGSLYAEYERYFGIHTDESLNLQAISFGINCDFPGPISLIGAVGNYSGNYRRYPYENYRDLENSWGAKWGVLFEQTIFPLVKLNAGINRRYLEMRGYNGPYNMSGTEIRGGITWGF